MVLTGACGTFSVGADLSGTGLTTTPEHHHLVRLRLVPDVALELHRMRSLKGTKLQAADRPREAA